MTTNRKKIIITILATLALVAIGFIVINRQSFSNDATDSVNLSNEEPVFNEHTRTDIINYISSINPSLASFDDEASLGILSMESPMENWLVVAMRPPKDNIDNVVIITVLIDKDGTLLTRLSPFPARLSELYVEENNLPEKVSNYLINSEYAN